MPQCGAYLLINIAHSPKFYVFERCQTGGEARSWECLFGVKPIGTLRRSNDCVKAVRSKQLVASSIALDPMPSHGGLTKPSSEFILAVQGTIRAFDVLSNADEVSNSSTGSEATSARYSRCARLDATGKLLDVNYRSVRSAVGAT
jgi:hypothetical protein